MTPQRIQRKRTKGWKMPGDAIYVGRPTQWGNPFHVGQWKNYTRADAVNDFKNWVTGKRLCNATQWGNGFGSGLARAAKLQLRGKDLACWCPLVDKDGNPVPCHADVLLEIANS